MTTYSESSKSEGKDDEPKVSQPLTFHRAKYNWEFPRPQFNALEPSALQFGCRWRTGELRSCNVGWRETAGRGKGREDGRMFKLISVRLNKAVSRGRVKCFQGNGNSASALTEL